MDFGYNQLSNLISNNQQEEKAKYHLVAAKIKMTAGLIKKMFGKPGHTKLILKSYGGVDLTSLPSLIYDSAKINHPLSKLLHEYVKKMDVIGDAASFFVLLVSELVSESIMVVEKGLKPALLAASFREIRDEVDEITEAFKIKHTVNFDDKESIKKVIKGIIKEHVLEEIVSEAISSTKSFDIENVRICKVGCGSVEDSYTVEGMVFDRAPEGLVKSVENATTSIYNCPIDIPRTEAKGTILMKNAEDLLLFSKEEGNEIKNTVNSIKSKVVICSGKIDNIYLDFFNKNDILVFKVLSKHDLRRLRSLLGGHISTLLHPLDDSSMGFVGEIKTFTEGKKTYTKFVSSNKSVFTLVLKNSVLAILDEQERLTQKALTTLYKNTKDNKLYLVKGAGYFEREISEKFAEKFNNTVDEKHMAYKCLSQAFKTFKTSEDEVYDVYNTKITAIKYALDFIATLYETSDYLIGKPLPLNITPQENRHWDEDH